MKLSTVLLLLALAALLSACASLPPRPMDNLQGATLTLREPLTFPAGDTRLHIQNGETKSWWRINQYRPHCTLQLDAARDRAHTLQAGDFRIARVRYEWDQVRQDAPVTVAGLGGLAGGAGSVTSRIEIVVFELESAEHPELTHLRCQQWMDPQYARYPSLEEVRWALGEGFQLEPPAAR